MQTYKRSSSACARVMRRVSFVRARVVVVRQPEYAHRRLMPPPVSSTRVFEPDVGDVQFGLAPVRCRGCSVPLLGIAPASRRRRRSRRWSAPAMPAVSGAVLRGSVLSMFHRLIGAKRLEGVAAQRGAAVPHGLAAAAAVFRAFPDDADAPAELPALDRAARSRAPCIRLRISMRSIGAPAATSISNVTRVVVAVQDVAHHAPRAPRRRRAPPMFGSSPYSSRRPVEAHARIEVHTRFPVVA